MSESKNDAALAYLLLRIVLGINIAFHGLSRILSGPSHFAAGVVAGFKGTLLPPPMVLGYALALPFVEATLGLLLFMGLFTRQALIGGMLLIASLTFGSTLRQDWESAGLQLIYAVVYAILLVRRGADNRYSADGFREAQAGTAVSR